jgi:hypothetical protein
VYCVQKVVRYDIAGNSDLTWTCTNTDCSTCQGTYCDRYTLTVSLEGATSQNFPTLSDCRYGITVEIQRSPSLDSDNSLSVREIAITGKPGEITHWYVRYVCTQRDTGHNKQSTIVIFLQMYHSLCTNT